MNRAKPGDIVLVRMPQTDLRDGKLRPAMVFLECPGGHGDLLLAAITSQERRNEAAWIETIDPSDGDYPASGLRVRSHVRVTRLATVSGRVVVGRLGRVSDRRLTRTRTLLCRALRAAGGRP
jgi:mRNA interferase MazF